jgi:hypothetical protein
MSVKSSTQFELRVDELSIPFAAIPPSPRTLRVQHGQRCDLAPRRAKNQSGRALLAHEPVACPEDPERAEGTAIGALDPARVAYDDAPSNSPRSGPHATIRPVHEHRQRAFELMLSDEEQRR